MLRWDNGNSSISQLLTSKEPNVAIRLSDCGRAAFTHGSPGCFPVPVSNSDLETSWIRKPTTSVQSIAYQTVYFTPRPTKTILQISQRAYAFFALTLEIRPVTAYDVPTSTVDLWLGPWLVGQLNHQVCFTGSICISSTTRRLLESDKSLLLLLILNVHDKLILTLVLKTCTSLLNMYVLIKAPSVHLAPVHHLNKYVNTHSEL